MKKRGESRESDTAVGKWEGFLLERGLSIWEGRRGAEEERELRRPTVDEGKKKKSAR